MKSFVQRAILVFLLTSLCTAVQAVMLVTDMGLLIGADDVLVDTTDDMVANPVRYDVRFVDGSCSGIFGGSCDDANLFDFNTEFAATAAAQSLLDQVFLDGPVLYDSIPELTFGCPNTFGFACFAVTPFADSNGSTFVGAFSGNFAFVGDEVRVFNFDDELNLQLDQGSGTVFARWSPSAAPIPEPATLFLFALGLAGIALGRRRMTQ